MDKLGPQQPDKSLRQKINKVLDDNSRSADEHEECIPREYYKEVVSEILALLKSQQPAEGGLVPNPYRCFCKLVRRMSDAEADEDYASHKFDAGRQAQLAHTMISLKAQGWVKLPSEDELWER